MVVMPTATEDTRPVAAPVVAMAVLLLLQVPAAGADAKVTLLPMQRAFVVGVKAAGVAFTVMGKVRKQPVESV